MKVRNIFEVSNEFAVVSVDSETFNAVRGVSPELPYTTSRTMDGKGVRIFEIDGVNLMSIYNKETKKTRFVMNQKEALAKLETLEDERSKEPTLPFAFGAFEASL